jgi:hypothetical protein
MKKKVVTLKVERKEAQSCVGSKSDPFKSSNAFDVCVALSILQSLTDYIF